MDVIEKARLRFNGGLLKLEGKSILALQQSLANIFFPE